MKKQYISQKIMSFVVEMEAPIADSPWLPVDNSGGPIDQDAVESKEVTYIDFDDFEDDEY